MSIVIKMKGLPFEATAKDIKSFFQGLHLREGDIHLAAYKDGKAAGIAFAVFHNDEDARKAMFKNGKYMGKRYIELFLSSSTEMNSMLHHGVPNPRQAREEVRDEGGRGQRSEGKPKENQRQNRFQKSSRSDRREVQIRSRSRSPVSRHGNPGQESDSRSFGGWGMMNSSLGSDSERLFESGDRGKSFFEMRWREEEDGRQDRYHRLQNEREFPKERMGEMSFQKDQRDIPVRRERSHGKEEIQGRRAHKRSPSPAKEKRNREDRNDYKLNCCRLDGLPYRITEPDIKDFFKGFSVQKIRLLYHAKGNFAGKKNGKGYVEFKSVKDAREAAKKKHKQYLKSRYVEVDSCTKGEMIEECNVNDEELQKAQQNDQMGDRDRDREPRYDSGKPISDLAIKINPQLFNSNYGMPNLLDNNPSLGNLGLSLPNPYMSSEAVDLQTLATLKQLESRANINPEDVTAGCVVGIRNLPSNVTADEILDFFYGFPVFSDSVRIHYLAPGRSSGDAMVTFRSSREATTAIRQLNNRPVGKRNIQLFLL